MFLVIFCEAICSSDWATRPQRRSQSRLAMSILVKIVQCSRFSAIGKRNLRERVMSYQFFILESEKKKNLQWRNDKNSCETWPKYGAPVWRTVEQWTVSAKVSSGQRARGAPRRNREEMVRREKELFNTMIDDRFQWSLVTEVVS